MNEPVPQLSESGRTRRTRMLTELTESISRLHRQRRNRKRIILTASPIIALLITLLFITRPQSTSRTTPKPIIAASESIAPTDAIATASTIIVRVRTDLAILDRYGVTSEFDSSIIIGDRELLDTLASIGRPTGLIRIEGEVRLSSNVVDRSSG